MNKLCVNCPFREGSEYGYDQDGLEAFAGGENTPACHEKVGIDNVFAHAPMEPEPGNVCRGYEMWLNEKPGFQIPRLTGATR